MDSFGFLLRRNKQRRLRTVFVASTFFLFFPFFIKKKKIRGVNLIFAHAFREYLSTKK